MAIEQVANLHEVKSAFPECVAAHCGHPIVCWKYATPSGIQLSNERTTMLHAHQLQHRPCNCCNMPAKYKDESGHVVTTDLSIIDHSQNHPDMRLQILMTLRTCCTPSDLSYLAYVVLFCVMLLTLSLSLIMPALQYGCLASHALSSGHPLQYI